VERLAIDLSGPYVIACAVLLLAGGMKMADPNPTRGALRAMGLPWRGPVVIALGGAEVFFAVVALVAGGTVAAIPIVVVYAGFAVFVAAALARHTPLSSCGCFGRDDTPPTMVHLLLDLVFTAVALIAMVGDVPPIDRILSDQPAHGIPFLGYVGLGVAACVLLLTSLPRTLALVTPRQEARG
jgi:hypothetical protein